MDKTDLEEWANTSHQLIVQHRQQFYANFNSWKENFPDSAVFNSLEPEKLWTIRYNDGTPKGCIVNGFDEFREAVKLACFCASRYQKNNDPNDVNFLTDQDTVKGLKSQIVAVKRILAKLKKPGPVLLAAGRCAQDPIGLDWKKDLQRLENLLKKYQVALNKVPSKPSCLYSLGCLEYSSSRKPTNTPSVETMLVIQLAVFIYSLQQYSNSSWFILHSGSEVNIPVDISQQMNAASIEAIIQSIDHSLNKEMDQKEVKDTLRQKIKTGMKLCPWPELKFHP